MWQRLIAWVYEPIALAKRYPAVSARDVPSVRSMARANSTDGLAVVKTRPRGPVRPAVAIALADRAGKMAATSAAPMIMLFMVASKALGVGRNRGHTDGSGPNRG